MIITFAIMAFIGLVICFVLKRKCRTKKEIIKELEKSPSPAKAKEELENSSSAIKPRKVIRSASKKEQQESVDLESSTRQQLNGPDRTGMNEVELGDFESGVYQSNTNLYDSSDKQAINIEAIKF